MTKAAASADDEDWKEADGWVGKWTIVGAGGNIEKIYEIRDGQFHPTNPRETYIGEVKMSEDTFIDLARAALEGKAEEVFAAKYAKRAIEYYGDQWVVDSERFRKVLKRLGAVKLKGVL